MNINTKKQFGNKLIFDVSERIIKNIQSKTFHQEIIKSIFVLAAELYPDIRVTDEFRSRILNRISHDKRIQRVTKDGNIIFKPITKDVQTR
ncbi:MAG: hypothetical protein HAW67_03310 [Endozoicomonadaceae bacterium]|nr:hypothetical protein [Endozoicomonadaceae bacterium]